MGWDRLIIDRARRLRSRGKTYSEICAYLGREIPKTTLNYWFGDIFLPDLYHRRVKKIVRLNGRKNIVKARAKNKELLRKRLLRLREKNIHLLERIDREVGVLMLSMLYLCEGAKYPTTSRSSLGALTQE